MQHAEVVLDHLGGLLNERQQHVHRIQQIENALQVLAQEVSGEPEVAQMKGKGLIDIVIAVLQRQRVDLRELTKCGTAVCVLSGARRSCACEGAVWLSLLLAGI
jgi:hypothetical protein